MHATECVGYQRAIGELALPFYHVGPGIKPGSSGLAASTIIP